MRAVNGPDLLRALWDNIADARAIERTLRIPYDVRGFPDVRSVILISLALTGQYGSPIYQLEECHCENLKLCRKIGKESIRVVTEINIMKL